MCLIYLRALSSSILEPKGIYKLLAVSMSTLDVPIADTMSKKDASRLYDRHAHLPMALVAVRLGALPRVLL
jgi:hypothetical protein